MLHPRIRRIRSCCSVEMRSWILSATATYRFSDRLSTEECILYNFKAYRRFVGGRDHSPNLSNYLLYLVRSIMNYRHSLEMVQCDPGVCADASSESRSHIFFITKRDYRNPTNRLLGSDPGPYLHLPHKQ